MSKKQWVYLLGHTFFTFTLAILLEKQIGVSWEAATVGAAVITLRDLDSLFDDSYGINSGISLPKENIDQEVAAQEGIK